MLAQEDDELFNWLDSAFHHAGSFLSTLAEAALRADAFNYPILRPALLFFKKKYPTPPELLTEPGTRSHWAVPRSDKAATQSPPATPPGAQAETLLLDACKRIVFEDESGEITGGAIEDCRSAIEKAEG